MTDKKIYSEVKLVSIDSVKPSRFENPNEFSEELYASFKKDVADNGLIGNPLIVNPVTNCLLDGNHRLKVLRELGYDKVPVTYTEPLDEIEEKILMISLNQKRGTFNEQKLHNLIKSIHDSGRYSLEELAMKLGFNNSEIKEKLEAIKIDEDLIKKLESNAQEQDKKLPVLMTFSIDKENEEVVKTALELAEAKTLGKALVEVCSSFIKARTENL